MTVKKLKHVSLGSAVKSSDIESVKEIYPQVKDKLKSEEKDALLLMAAAQQSLPIVEYFLQNGMDASAAAPKGMKIQHIVAEQGSIEMLQMMHKNGLSLDVRDSDGSTPLHYLLRHEEEIEENTDLNAPSGHAHHPGMKHPNAQAINAQLGVGNAASGSSSPPPANVKSMSEALMGMNVNLNLGDLEGRRPLHYAVMRLKNCKTKKQKEEGHALIMEMIDKGADPGQADAYNHVAAEYLPEGEEYNELFNYMEEQRESRILQAQAKTDTQAKPLRI